MEFLDIRRVDEEAFTPEYQAVTNVLNTPNARIAMVMPRTVSAARSLWRRAFRNMSFRTCIEYAFFQALYKAEYEASQKMLP